MKYCIKCKQEKSLDKFGLDNQRKDKKNPYCKDCINMRIFDRGAHSKSVIKWANNNIEKKRKYRRESYHRNLSYLSKYGVDKEWYNNQLVLQNYVCAICKQKNKNGKRLSVDHDHLTNIVRQLLCNPCNTFIGYINEDTSTLQNMITYLEKFND